MRNKAKSNGETIQLCLDCPTVTGVRAVCRTLVRTLSAHTFWAGVLRGNLCYDAEAMADENAARIAPGTMLCDTYLVEERLGGGGYGDVFRARSMRLDRLVAIKVMRSSPVRGQGVLARFRREAQIAKRLEHPNTVRLFDFGSLEDGTPFLVWELLRGETLVARIERAGALPPAAVGRMALQALASLEEAHAAGIVHRDIKPSNLMLCDFAGAQDFLKVLDFGVAKDVSVAEDDLTGEGEVLGTPRYMAPEQVLGRGVVPATDLYALGLVMAEALAGSPVLSASSKTQVVAMQAMNQDLEIAEAVLSGPLGAVVRRATRKRMGARYSSATLMRDAIRGSLRDGERTPEVEGPDPREGAKNAPASGSGIPETLSPMSVSGSHATITQRKDVPLPAAKRGPRRRRSLGMVLGWAGALVALGGVAGVLLWKGTEPKEPSDSPEGEAPLDWHPATRPLPEGTDLRSFDALVFLPVALGRARELRSDAEWTRLLVSGVWSDGRADLLGIRQGAAIYWFRSPSASRPPDGHPDNLLYEGRCQIAVTVDERGLSAQVPLLPCDEPFAPRPRCTIKDVSERFLASVRAERASFGGTFDYRVGDEGFARWIVDGGTLGTEIFPDDCTGR